MIWRYRFTLHSTATYVLYIESMTKLHVTSKCKIKKNKIIGISKAKDNKKFGVQLRLTRLDSLE